MSEDLGDNIAEANIPDLEYIVKIEYFINCPFLPTAKFIDYCEERSISTSLEQLERFEKFGVFYPIARFHYPTELVFPHKYSDKQRTPLQAAGHVRAGHKLLLLEF